MKVAPPSSYEAAFSSAPRRRTSRGAHDPIKNLASLHSGAVIGTTPFNEEEEYMSLDRSPSPRAGGGWSSPGLNATTPPNGRLRGASPGKKQYGDLGQGSGSSSSSVTWETAKANSARVNGYPTRFQSQNQGFFARHMRRLSSSLPHFAHGGQEDRYAEKEKLGRGRIPMGKRGWKSLMSLEFWRELPRRIWLLLARRRKIVAMVLVLVMMVVLLNNKSEPYTVRQDWKVRC